MCSVVTVRFVECLDKLREKGEIRSARQFALALDYHPQNLNDIMRHKRDVTIELIKKSAELFRLNPQYVFTGTGSMFLDEEVPQQSASTGKVHDAAEKIVYVPVAAHAGYSEQFGDPVFMDELTTFSLPDYRFQRGNHRCFDIAGDSMEPSLYAGDKVVCSLVDTHNFYSSVRNNLVYVVVMDGAVVVKRIQNHVREKGTFLLISDNSYYTPYEVHVDEVREIWHVEVKISPYLPSPNNIRNAFHEEMDDMKRIIDQQSKSIQVLNLTVEKLLRQNRAVL